MNKKMTKTGLKAGSPDKVVQIDLKYLVLRGATYYQYTAIDKYSRMVFANVYYSYPRTPKTNGNVERVIRTIEEEL